MTSCQKMVTSLGFLQFTANLEQYISKIKRVLVLKGLFFKTICVTKFEISSVIPMRFNGVVLPTPPLDTLKQTPKKPTQIRVKF